MQVDISRDLEPSKIDHLFVVLAEGPLDVDLPDVVQDLVRGGITTAGRMAKKQRDAKIAVLFPYTLPNMDDDETAFAVADVLAQSDYKYDTFITVKKEPKKIAIRATVIAPSADAKTLNPKARALAAAVRTVRDLGNGPSNLVTPSWLAERAAEVCKEVGVKCTVYGRREIERMKMGGILAVNRGSSEEPRFVVKE
jgi:leucyl aminopeptidase